MGNYLSSRVEKIPRPFSVCRNDDYPHNQPIFQLATCYTGCRTLRVVLNLHVAKQTNED